MSEDSSVNELKERADVYFRDEEMQRGLSNVVQKLISDYSGDNGFLVAGDNVLRFLVITLGSMRNNAKMFDGACAFNIEIIGSEFRDLVATIDLSKDSQVELLAALAYRFVTEFQVVFPGEVSAELAISASDVRSATFNSNASSHIDYAQHSMLIAVLRKYLHHDRIVSIKNLPTLLDRAERVRTDSEESLDKRVGKVKHLEEALDKIKIRSDFVELAEGFASMRFKKEIEKHFNFFSLILLAVLLVSPAALKVYFYYSKIDIPQIDIYTAVSIGALELIFVYFFRVALHNFRAVKAQILQLDLRVALLQFIQSYAKFAKGERASGEATFDKFEQLIFSGLVSGEKDLPSTFDGLDGVAKIIDKLRPPK